MGFAMCMAPCLGCGRTFSFNPMRVPSLDLGHGRQPVCLSCVERVNPQRIANGLPPIEPLPGAYEPMDEGEWPHD